MTQNIKPDIEFKKEMEDKITLLEKKLKVRSYLSLLTGCYGAINAFIGLGFSKNLLVYAWLSTLPLLVSLIIIIPILNREIREINKK